MYDKHVTFLYSTFYKCFSLCPQAPLPSKSAIGTDTAVPLSELILLPIRPRGPVEAIASCTGPNLSSFIEICLRCLAHPCNKPHGFISIGLDVRGVRRLLDETPFKITVPINVCRMYIRNGEYLTSYFLCCFNHDLFVFLSADLKYKLVSFRFIIFSIKQMCVIISLTFWSSIISEKCLPRYLEKLNAFYVNQLVRNIPKKKSITRLYGFSATVISLPIIAGNSQQIYH